MTEITKRPGNGYRLTTELKLPVKRREVFDFFSDAFQLEQITPPWLKFSLITPRPIQLREGAVIDYQLSLYGIPIRWKSRISCWDPPRQFVDEQIRGPYQRWVHLHTFTEEDDMTVCRDQVDYRCWGGPLLHWLFIERDLRAIFAYRQQALQQLFARSSFSAC